nr:transposase [Streptomyces sp. GS7]
MTFATCWCAPASGSVVRSCWYGTTCAWHLTKSLREFVEANSGWLTVFQLPTYAPDLNPQEGVWFLVKRDIGDLAAACLDQITWAVKHRLKQIQCRPDLVDGCLAATGLIMDG